MVLLMGALLRLRKQEILKNSLTLPVALSTLFYPKTFWAILRVLYCKQFFKILTILEMRTFMPEQRDLFLLPVHCHHWMFFSFNLHSASLHWEVRWIMRVTWHRRLWRGGGGGVAEPYKGYGPIQGKLLCSLLHAKETRFKYPQWRLQFWLALLLLSPWFLY